MTILKFITSHFNNYQNQSDNIKKTLTPPISKDIELHQWAEQPYIVEIINEHCI